MSLTLPSVAEVRAVFTTSLDDTAVQSFIDDAALVAEQCTSVTSAAEARQKSIVKYVAAHLMYCAGLATGASKGSVVSEKLGDASVSYAAAPASGATASTLGSSSFGRQAILLDASGCLAGLGKPKAFLSLVRDS